MTPELPNTIENSIGGKARRYELTHPVNSQSGRLKRHGRQLLFWAIAVAIALVLVSIFTPFITGVTPDFCIHDCGPTASPLQITSLFANQSEATLRVFNPTLASYRLIDGLVICIPIDSYGNCNNNSPTTEGFNGPRSLVGPLQTTTIVIPFPKTLPHGTFSFSADVWDNVNGNPAFYRVVTTI